MICHPLLHRRWRVLFCCMLCLVPLWLLAAPVIRDIEIENIGAAPIDADYVKSHIGSQIGSELNTSRTSSDVKALLKTGLFSSVTVSVEQDDDGIVLVYVVRPKYRLASPPRFRGAHHFKSRKLRELLELEPGDRVDDHVIGAQTRAIIDSYRDDRYHDVTCTWSIEPQDKSRGLVDLVIDIDEGPRSAIKRIRVTGNEVLATSELRKPLRKPAPYNIFRWIWRKRYQPFELAAIEADVKSKYMDEGHLEVSVTSRISAPDDKGRKTATIAVDEGPRYTVGHVALTGVSLFPENEINGALAALDMGAVASYAAILRVASDIQAFYGNRGYIDTVVHPIMNPDVSNRVVDITFRVEEGELVSLRNIRVQGNTRTMDKVIRRELLVYPGDTYNQERISRSERRLQNLGFFEAVRAIPTRTPDPAERDLVMTVSEKRTGQFMIGAGFSSVENIIGFMEISQGNFDILNWPSFTGAGQKLRLQIQYGNTSQDYQLSFTEPWFLDRRLSLGFDVFRRNRDYSDYDEERTGFSISLGKPLPGPNRINFKYTLEESSITDVADTNIYYELDSYDFDDGTGSPYSFVNEEDRTRSSLSISVVHDTRNNPFVPSRGRRATLFYTLTGGVMGFDTDTYEIGIRFEQHIPLWFRHVVSIETRAQTIEAFDDTETVPLADRLFLGGGRTLRGFDYRDVGPKVISPGSSGFFYHRPQGGQSLAVANLEYAIPIVPNVRLAAFYDIGNVWRDAYTFDFEDMASAAGVGVRLDMPGFPIRIDRAWVIEADDRFTDDDPWVIWIGY